MFFKNFATVTRQGFPPRNQREITFRIMNSCKPVDSTNDMTKAFSILKDGSNVFMQGAAATPTLLAYELKRFVIDKKLKNITVYHIHTDGPYPFLEPECENHLRSVSLFTGQECRRGIDSGRATWIPIFLSEIPKLFRCGHVPLDLAIVSLSPDIAHEYYSLGTSIDVTKSAVQNAKVVVGQLNKELPYTFGDANIHKSQVDFIMKADMPIHKLKERKINKIEEKIAEYISDNLVDDGATLQMGIGSIPDAVLSKLQNHKNLGIHTEMFSDGLVDLVDSGAVTNKYKKLYNGKIVSSFVVGTQKVFDFLHRNPLVDIEYVNSPINVCKNPKVTAINSCIEIDLTGQVCADSIGSRIFSGFGGQLDFIYGSSIGHDGLGMPIIAMPSIAKRGDSKITPYLKEGAGVVTTRAHVRYVVTEYGIAYLFGKTLRQRAYELIKIAHPDKREELEKAAFQRFKSMPSKDP